MKPDKSSSLEDGRLKHKGPIIILIIGILLTIAAPIILVRPSFSQAFNFSNTGQIGDTIGGITAPFINIIAAALVYFSFMEQYRANNIQIRALREEREDIKHERKYHLLLQLIYDLESRIRLFVFRMNGNPSKQILEKSYVGVDGLQRFTNTVWKERDAFVGKIKDMDKETAITLTYYSECYFLTKLLLFITDKIDESNLPSDLKIDICDRLDITYQVNLKSSIETLIEALDLAGSEHIAFLEIKDMHEKYLSTRKQFTLK